MKIPRELPYQYKIDKRKLPWATRNERWDLDWFINLNGYMIETKAQYINLVVEGFINRSHYSEDTVRQVRRQFEKLLRKGVIVPIERVPDYHDFLD